MRPAAGHRVFVAGASGAIGRRLCRLLVAEDRAVAGTTRSADKAVALRALGALPVLVDVFDGEGLRRAVAAFAPEIVVHQLTDLPPALDPSRMAEARVRNARLAISARAICSLRPLPPVPRAWSRKASLSPTRRARCLTRKTRR